MICSGTLYIRKAIGRPGSMLAASSFSITSGDGSENTKRDVLARELLEHRKILTLRPCRSESNWTSSAPASAGCCACSTRAWLRNCSEGFWFLRGYTRRCDGRQVHRNASPLRINPGRLASIHARQYPSGDAVGKRNEPTMKLLVVSEHLIGPIQRFGAVLC